jgi:hypothetical protein
MNGQFPWQPAFAVADHRQHLAIHFVSLMHSITLTYSHQISWTSEVNVHLDMNCPFGLNLLMTAAANDQYHCKLGLSAPTERHCLPIHGLV